MQQIFGRTGNRSAMKPLFHDIKVGDGTVRRPQVAINEIRNRFAGLFVRCWIFARSGRDARQKTFDFLAQRARGHFDGL